MKNIRKIKAILLISWRDTIAYPADILIIFLSSLVFIAIQYFLWGSVYQARTDIGGFDYRSLVSYIALVSIASSLLGFSSIERGIQTRVLNGKIALDMTLPFDYQGYHIAYCYGRNAFSFLASGIPLYLFAVLLLRLPIPAFATLLLFLVSLHLGFLIGSNISFIIGIFSFPLKNNEGIIQIKKFISLIFSGALVPLSFFPPLILKTANFLPFKGIIFIPVQIYLGKIKCWDSLYALLFQVFWVSIIILLGRLLFLKFRKKIEAFGC